MCAALCACLHAGKLVIDVSGQGLGAVCGSCMHADRQALGVYGAGVCCGVGCWEVCFCTGEG